MVPHARGGAGCPDEMMAVPVLDATESDLHVGPSLSFGGGDAFVTKVRPDVAGLSCAGDIDGNDGHGDWPTPARGGPSAC